MPSESPQYPRGRDPYGINDPDYNPDGTTTYALKPVPENYQQPVFPYRGVQQHGVHPSNVQEPPDHMTEGGVVQVAPPKKPPDPVPVRIVEGGTREYQQWRAYQTYVGAGPGQIVNRKENRQSLSVKNIGTIHVWVGPDSSLTKQTGFRLDSNGGQFTLDGEAEVWAMSDDGSTVPVAVYFQFTTGT